MIMKEEIYIAIEKNLSAHVGEVLKEQLQLLDDYKARDIVNSTRIQELSEQSLKRQVQISDLQMKLYSHDDITKRESEVHARELKQDLKDLELKLSELRRQDSIKLVELVFKSPSYQKSIYGNVPAPVAGSVGVNGGLGTSGTVVNSNYSLVETVSQS
jgi:Asp-tRNA(Asn)/Glu-tRNA(Gln) amidotransferase B subunit